MAVEHVGNAGEGVPVFGMYVCEGPNHIVPMQAGANMYILQHITRVVIIDELKLSCLAERYPDDRDETKRDCDFEDVYAHNGGEI